MPGTKNRHEQAPSNARKRQEQHRERVAALRARRRKSPERQARLHPSRAEKKVSEAFQSGDLFSLMGAHNATRPGFSRDVPMNQSFVRNLEVFDPTNPIGPILSNEQIILRAIGVDPAAHPLPWRAPDKKTAGKGWHILDADGDIAEYAKSRDKARARAQEVNR
jgi:hypothetical protein